MHKSLEGKWELFVPRLGELESGSLIGHKALTEHQYASDRQRHEQAHENDVWQVKRFSTKSMKK